MQISSHSTRWSVCVSILLAGLTVLGLSASPSVAAIVAFEPFGAGANNTPLTGTVGGGSGTTGAWTYVSGTDALKNRTLTMPFPVNVPFTSNSGGVEEQATWPNAVSRLALASPINLAADGTYYMSWTGKVPSNDARVMVGLWDTAANSGLYGGFTYGGANNPNPYRVEGALGSVNSTLTYPGASSPNTFYVLKVVSSAAGNDQAFLKVYYSASEFVHASDAALSGMGTGANHWTVVSTGAATNLSLNSIQLSTGSGLKYPQIDEIRVGTTWQDVVGVTPGWTVDADGNWSDDTKWSPAQPSGTGSAAEFGPAITAPRTVTVDVNRTVGSINFNNASSYTLAGPGTISMDVASGKPLISAMAGNHTISAPLVMVDATNVTVHAGSTLTLSGTVSGTTSLTKLGAGTLALSGANTYTGGTGVEAGTLIVNSISDGNCSIGPSSGGANYLGLANATLQYTGAGAASTTRRLWIDRGTGTFDITQPTGVLTWTAGTDSTRNKDIVKTGPGRLELNAVISGGALTVNQGALRLGAVNTYTGNTTVNGGTLTIVPGAVIYADAYRTPVLRVQGGGTLELQNWGYDATASHTMSLGGLTYNVGNLVLDNGTIRIVGTAPTSSARSLDILAGGGTLEAAAGTNWTIAYDATHSIRSNAGGTLTLAGSGTGAISKIIPGTGGLAKTGTGVWTLTAANTYSGNTTVGNGTLKVGPGGVIYADAYRTSTLTVQSGGVLELENWGYDQSAAHTMSLGGLRANAPSMVLDGGTVRVNGTTSYGRGITMTANGATLEAAAGANWTLAYDVNHGIVNTAGSLTLAGAGTGRLDKSFGGTGGLTKTGAGTWTLGAANTFAGATAVQNGTLKLADPSALQNTPLIDLAAGATLDVTGLSGPFALAAGQTLKGMGKVLGDLSAGGLVSPGASPGTLTVEGDFTLGASGDLAIELAGVLAGSGYDQLVVNGSTSQVSLAGDLLLSLAFAPDQGSQYLILLNNGPDPISGTFAGLLEGQVFVLYTPGGDDYQFAITYVGGTGNDVELTAVPEPATALLLAVGLAGLARRIRRRTSNA